MNYFASSMIQFGLHQMKETKRANEEWKTKLRQEWRDSMKLPRKKKKQRRKEIMIDWSIACYEPFGGLDFNLDELETFFK